MKRDNLHAGTVLDRHRNWPGLGRATSEAKYEEREEVASQRGDRFEILLAS